MRKEHRPQFLLNIIARWNSFYLTKFLVPQFESFGSNAIVVGGYHIKVFGENIHLGTHPHIVANKHLPIQLTTWSSKQQQGHIDIGDYCLIAPGVKIQSAEKITIGKNCMIASEAYISDSDWHGTYNRLRPFRCSKAINIKDNAWIGYRAIIGKGVTVGENSIVGAGSVVMSSIPDNVVVAGNPATIIKQLDTKKRMLKREYLFSQDTPYIENQKTLNQYMFHGNSLYKWLTSIFMRNKKH